MLLFTFLILLFWVVVKFFLNLFERRVAEQEIKLKGMVVSIMTILISTTSTARKIMEVFRYFRIKRNDILSTKLLLSKRHLWRDIEEEDFSQAMGELMKLGYIAKMESPAGWRLLESGDDYLKQLELRLI